MLDVITDFWKPVKKAAPLEKPDLDKLQQGSALSFGTVPQGLVSGKRFTVSAINTYQFGDERMTSFVLTNEKEESVSLIVASAEGEQYLAISRRIAFADRMRMFDPAELEAVAEQPDAVKLACREIDANWKHWVVSAYKKEISGLRGAVLKGDFRGRAVPANVQSQPFDYLLLTSDNNEYAIEIERYADGRLEIYATIYRRVSDIVELENLAGEEEPRMPAPPVLEVVKPVEKATPEKKSEDVLNEKVEKLRLEAEALEAKQEASAKPAPEAVKAEEKPAPTAAPSRPTPFKQSTEAPVIVPPPAPPLPHPTKNAAPAPVAPAPVTPAPAAAQPSTPAAAAPVAPNNSSSTQTLKETKPMQMSQNALQSNGSATNSPFKKQEMTAVNTHTPETENEAIECDLRVANKIIEEAIRTEMRLSDVVRRIIALPVAYPESVQIPMTLTDADFQLLAIRYGISAADRNAIKGRIIEEINDFSGNGKK